MSRLIRQGPSHTANFAYVQHRTYRHPDAVLWQRIPFLIIAFAFVAGMIGQTVLKNHVCVLILAATLGLALVLRGFMDARLTRRIIALALIASLGTVIMSENRHQPSRPAHGTMLCATVISSVQSARSTRAIVSSVPGNQRIVAYLAPDFQLTFGDTIMTDATPQQITAPALPWTFDVARFYAHRGIYQRVFIGEEVEVRPRTRWHLRRWSERTRALLSESLTRTIRDPDNRSVLLAMLLGERDDLPEATRDAFARSGTIHILAISGLHIGIVASLLLLILGKHKPGQSTMRKAGRCALVLSGVWGFTLISGLAPSAVRAAFMFSIYCVGQIWDRGSNGLNILGCTAFISLLIKPELLFSVSFQFSYLALLGILAFGRPMYRMIPLRSRVARTIWGIFCISVAAQILLIPASAYYFNQVSLISPLMSLLAIPIAYVLVGGGVVLLAVSFVVPAMAQLFAGGLSAVLSFLNAIVNWSAGLSFSAATNLYLPDPLLPVVYGALFFVVLSVLTRRGRWIVWAAGAGCIAIISLVNMQDERQRGTTLTVYPTESDFMLDVVAGSTCYTSIDSVLTGYEEDIVVRSRRHKFILPKQVKLMATTGQNATITLGDTRIALWRNGPCPQQPYDYVIVGAGVERQWWDTMTSPGCQVILAKSLKYSARRGLRKMLNRKAISTHCLRYDGPFEIQLPHHQITEQ